MMRCGFDVLFFASLADILYKGCMLIRLLFEISLHSENLFEGIAKAVVDALSRKMYRKIQCEVRCGDMGARHGGRCGKVWQNKRDLLSSVISVIGGMVRWTCMFKHGVVECGLK